MHACALVAAGANISFPIQHKVPPRDRSPSARRSAAHARGRSAYPDPCGLYDSLAGDTMVPALQRGRKRVRSVVDDGENPAHDEILELVEYFREEIAECRSTSAAKVDVDAIGTALSRELFEVQKDLKLLASTINAITAMEKDALDLANDEAGISCSTEASNVSAPSKQTRASTWEEFGPLGGEKTVILLATRQLLFYLLRKSEGGTVPDEMLAGLLVSLKTPSSKSLTGPSIFKSSIIPEANSILILCVSSCSILHKVAKEAEKAPRPPYSAYVGQENDWVYDQTLTLCLQAALSVLRLYLIRRNDALPYLETVTVPFYAATGVLSQSTVAVAGDLSTG